MYSQIMLLSTPPGSGGQVGVFAVEAKVVGIRFGLCAEGNPDLEAIIRIDRKDGSPELEYAMFLPVSFQMQSIPDFQEIHVGEGTTVTFTLNEPDVFCQAFIECESSAPITSDEPEIVSADDAQ